MDYDVIIGGASFAGLALARAVLRQSRARVLLVDRRPLGDGQTSACALPLEIVKEMGAEQSVLQVHRYLWVHTPAGTSRWQLPTPFCTIDYRRFCVDTLKDSPAHVIRRPVLGVQGRAVVLPGARVEGRVLVDATGWRAVMASSVDPGYVARRGRWMGAGLETELPYRWTPGLHFHFDPDLVPGYAWAFGCGESTRFGVASYDLRAPLKRALRTFLNQQGVTGDGPLHGGRLASGLREPVVGPVFVVGDAVGQCLPATGEGIRPAIRAADACGNLIAGHLSGRYSLREAAERYRRLHFRNRSRYYFLAALQLLSGALPSRAFLSLARLLEHPYLMQLFMSRYLAVMGPEVRWRPPEPSGSKPPAADSIR